MSDHPTADQKMEISTEVLNSVIQVRHGFDSAIDRVRKLENAAKRALNFLENTESELGIELPSAQALRDLFGEHRG